MKKFASIILSLVLSFALCGCSTNPDSVSADASSEEIVSTESELSSEVASSEEPEPENKETTVILSFAGDFILATQKDATTSGSFNDYSNRYEPSYFLEKVKHIFESDDLTIVNFENVLTDNALSPVYKNYDPAFWFKSRTSNVRVLTEGSVEVASINNNHIMDYGQQGYDDTVAALKNAGVMVSSKYDTLYYEKEGIKLAVISVALWGSSNLPAAQQRLEEAKLNSDYQIIVFHGGTEAVHKPEQWKINSARALVDSGADLVIGGHPHVLQPREVYNGVEIIYSLGNFCYGGSRRPENATVIYQIKLTFAEDKTLVSGESELIPCYVYTGSINNYQPTPIVDEAAKQKILDFMDGLTDSPLNK